METLTPKQRAKALRSFEAKFIPEPNSGCWLWDHATDTQGYGQLTIKKVTRGAHRLSWVLHHGPIPNGLCVCHRCDVRCCVNPDHLFLGTPFENTRDMVRKGRCRRAAGAANGRAKLGDSAVSLIRAASPLTSEHRAQLAKRFGVSIRTMYRIEQGIGYQAPTHNPHR